MLENRKIIFDWLPDFFPCAKTKTKQKENYKKIQQQQNIAPTNKNSSFHTNVLSISLSKNVQSSPSPMPISPGIVGDIYR